MQNSKTLQKQTNLTGDVLLARYLRELREVQLLLDESYDGAHAPLRQVARHRRVRARLRDDADVGQINLGTLGLVALRSGAVRGGGEDNEREHGGTQEADGAGVFLLGCRG